MGNVLLHPRINFSAAVINENTILLLGSRNGRYSNAYNKNAEVITKLGDSTFRSSFVKGRNNLDLLLEHG